MAKRIGILIVVLAVTAGFAAVKSGSPLTDKEQLGKFLFFDKIAEPDWMTCADCHAPSFGFTGPIPGINRHGAVYRGAVPQRFGNRKPPSAAYATLAPIFHYDSDEGLFIGGNFWDGRATGERLGNPAAEQALGPFLNPVEMNNPSKLAVLRQVAGSKYAWLWPVVWNEPLVFDTQDDLEKNYDRIGLAIAAYEGSTEVNAFSSKFDLFWKAATDAGLDVAAVDLGNWMDYSGYGLTDQETWGLAVFADEYKGKCALCHVLTTPDGGGPPLFTDFSFDNLGVPKNPDNPFYKMGKVYLNDGSPINPLGSAWVDLGLGGFLAGHPNPEWQAMAGENYGKHKVPTLRNVDKRSGEEMPKAFTHNGFFKSLKEIVHFYNTRDLGGWPPPEVSANVNHEELGDLGLSEEEEDGIVLFMQTLSDGYTRFSPKEKTRNPGVLTAARAGLKK
jgi:cytochrome c peroxidase